MTNIEFGRERFIGKNNTVFRPGAGVRAGARANHVLVSNAGGFQHCDDAR